MAALLTTMLTVSGLPSLSASGSANPEISDSAHDVNPAAFFADTPDNQPAFQNVTAYDIEKVYVLLETSTDLLLQFKVVDLPDRWALPPQLPADQAAEVTHTGPNASQPSVVLAANFTVRGVTYEATANLSQPTGQGLRDSYDIAAPGGGRVPVSGSYDVLADTVTLSIRKALLGSPQRNDVLTKFRAEGRFGDAKLDFAPNAVDYTPGSVDPGLVSIVVQTLTGQQLVQPRYGANYTFNYRAGSGDIELSADSREKTVAAGNYATYAFQVKNLGGAADTVYLTLSRSDKGYEHKLTLSDVSLAPGESKLVQLTVSAAPDARGLAISIVEARSRLGDTDSLVFETTIAEPGSVPSSGGSSAPAQNEGGGGAPPDGSSSQAPFSPTHKRTKSVPAAQLIAVAGTLLGLVAVLAMRRRGA
jgi:hypothetical protein